MGDTLAQPRPGPPKTPPLPPLPHNCSELPERGPRQEQQQRWGQAWGGHGDQGEQLLGGCWVGTQVSEGGSWEGLDVWGRCPARSRQDRGCLGRGSERFRGLRGLGEVQMGRGGRE